MKRGAISLCDEATEEEEDWLTALFVFRIGTIIHILF